MRLTNIINKVLLEVAIGQFDKKWYKRILKEGLILWKPDI